MVNDIKGLFQSKHAVGGLYIGLIGMIGGELLPSPTDPIDFWLERKWRIQLEKEEITPKVYWDRMTAKYYLLDSSYLALVFLTAVLIKGDFKKKAMVVGGILGAGAMIGMISSNIKKDITYFEKFKLVPKDKPA